MNKTEKMPGGIVCGIVFAVLLACIAAGTLIAGIILTLIFSMQEHTASEMGVSIGLLVSGIVTLILTVVDCVITDRKRKAWRALHPLDKRTRRIRGRIIAGYVFCGFFALAVAGFLPTTIELVDSYGFDEMSILFCGLMVVFLALSIFSGVMATRQRKALNRSQQLSQSQGVDSVATAAQAENIAQQNEPNVATNSGGASLEKGKTKFPDKAWFEQQGMPLQEIPIDKKQLKNDFSDDEKYILSVASFAVAKKRALIMLGIVVGLLIVLLVGVIIDDLSTIIIGIAALLLGGGFLTYKTTRLLEGMSILKASSRIGIPAGWSFLFAVLTLVGNVLSFYMFAIHTLLDMSKRDAMTSMPRVAMPQNCEFDDMIAVYSAYEQSASVSQAWDEHVAHLEKESYEIKTRELQDLKTDVKKSDELTSTEKADLTSKIDSTQKELDEDYKKNTKPRL